MPSGSIEKPLIIFLKSFIIDVLQGPRYAAEIISQSLRKLGKLIIVIAMIIIIKMMTITMMVAATTNIFDVNNNHDVPLCQQSYKCHTPCSRKNSCKCNWSVTNDIILKP